jgi:pimeloyl-ACP methyl ester carboxylesterase
MARYSPSVAYNLLESRYRKLLENPANILEQYESGSSPADMLLHRDPEIHKIRLQNIQDAAARPPGIFAQELVTLSRDWGFRLSELKTPVILWHGRQDELYPFEHAKAMADIIPHCEALFDDSWGHFFHLKQWENIFRTLTQ